MRHRQTHPLRHPLEHHLKCHLMHHLELHLALHLSTPTGLRVQYQRADEHTQYAQVCMVPKQHPNLELKVTGLTLVLILVEQMQLLPASVRPAVVLKPHQALEVEVTARVLVGDSLLLSTIVLAAMMAPKRRFSLEVKVTALEDIPPLHIIVPAVALETSSVTCLGGRDYLLRARGNNALMPSISSLARSTQTVLWWLDAIPNTIVKRQNWMGMRLRMTILLVG
jgi:hypothetical protein